MNREEKLKQKIKEKHQRSTERIKGYLKEHEIINKDLLDVTRFDVKEHWFGEDPAFKRIVPNAKPRLLTQIFATVDVPKERRKNPFLQDDFHFVLSSTGKVTKATKRTFGSGEKNITKFVKAMTRL